METILIATDFSPAARNATRYGFELSKAMNAKVILFNAYRLPGANPESFAYLPASDYERLSYEQLAKEAETLDANARVALETQSSCGPIGDAVLSAAEKNNVSFIVIGMKGYGKELRKYFGSTVTLLSKTSSIPLIVVPEEASFSVPKTIALASDINSATDIRFLTPLKKLADHFNSKVFIVRVIKKSMTEAFERRMKSERLDWYLACLNHSFEYLEGDDVAKAMNTFVEEHSADLVAVIPHEHNLVERLFTRSVTKDLIFHTRVPLLILPLKTADKVEADADADENNYYFNYPQGIF
jgi:nucleotide-binding universal stress UspA family protein